MKLDVLWTQLKHGAGEFINKIGFSVLVFIGTALLIKLLHVIINRIFDRQIDNVISKERQLRLKTIQSLLRSIVTYALFILGILYIMTVFFGPMGLALTSVGGVAIGLAAKDFIKDVISGFFILFEEKFRIGEYIIIGNFRGYVEEIGLRTTVLRDFSGDLHIIPNGNIMEVTNVSRGNRRFLVDVTIAAGQPVEAAADLLKEISQKFAADHPGIIQGPNYMGVVGIKDLGPTLRIQGLSSYEDYFALENELRKEVIHRFTQAGIRLAVPLFAGEARHDF